MSIQTKLLTGLQLRSFPCCSLLSSTRRPISTYRIQILGYKPVIQLPKHPTDLALQQAGNAVDYCGNRFPFKTLSRRKISLVAALVSGMWNALKARCKYREVGNKHITVAAFWIYVKFPFTPTVISSLPSLNQTYQTVSYTSSSKGSGHVTVQSLVTGCSIQVPGFNLRAIQ